MNNLELFKKVKETNVAANLADASDVILDDISHATGSVEQAALFLVAMVRLNLIKLEDLQ